MGDNMSRWDHLELSLPMAAYALPSLDIATKVVSFTPMTDNMTAVDRARATVYTSGEHCPMCAAAHGWVGLGRIVYASSAAQMTEWLSELGVPAFRVLPLPIGEVIRDTRVDGPVEEFAQQVRKLHIQSHSG